MNLGKFILVNGTFIPAEEYRISLSESEGFLFSERIRAVRTAFPFFSETLDLIKLKLRIFGHTFPDLTANEGSGLKRQLERTLTKNKLILGAVFTISLRHVDLKMEYSIHSAKLEDADYELNEKGMYVEVFDEIQKSRSSISMLSLGSEMYWKIASNQLTNPLTDHFFILNTKNQIVEIKESNIYIINGNLIRGVSINIGAYQDISYRLMLSVFGESGLIYNEEKGMSIQDIRDAEEILIVNSIDGIRWIVGFEGKRYYCKTIRRINELFKKMISIK